MKVALKNNLFVPVSPELGVDWAYPAFWIACLVMAGFMVLFFHRKGWL